MVLLNVYAPNWDYVIFTNSLLSIWTVTIWASEEILTVIDRKLDRSHPRTHQSMMSKAFSICIQWNGCTDPWILQNTLVKEFSIFLLCLPHLPCNYFLIDNALMPAVDSYEYLAIVISDHAPSTFRYKLLLCQKDRPFWRLPTFWWNILYLNCNRFTNFLETNKSDRFLLSPLGNLNGFSEFKLFLTLPLFIFLLNA